MEDTTKLKEGLRNIINEINQTFDKLKQEHIVNPDVLLLNSTLNNHINTFSFTANENHVLIFLTEKIQSILQQTFSLINEKCRKYLLNLLHQYHYDPNEKKFQQTLSLNNLHYFLNDLQALQASLDAFQAAWDGNKLAVRNFIKQYPQFKNRPGIWGTTLLYSAARNNKLELVQYLIEDARCSINAQNQQHVEKLLTNLIVLSKNYDHAPTAGSTALHAACFNNHLEMVKYLVNHGADYYITNHAAETSITNAKYKKKIEEFFQDYLILGYSIQTKTLPERPIIEGGQNLIDDCIWEYKPFSDTQWFPFSSLESNVLSQSLKVQSTDEFQEEIHLKVSRGVYSVSMIKFLRSGKNLSQNQSLAWIRCRGSSILNFDCHELWQIMFIKHPSIDSKVLPSLEVLQIPSIIDSNFKLQANAWYNCPYQINSTFSKTINYRRKILPMKLSFINEQLIFNFQTFQFSNDNQTIIGSFRWIPKLISSNGLNTNKLIHVENFKPTVGLNPIPMKTDYQKIYANSDENIIEGDEEHEMTDDVDGGNLITPKDDLGHGKQWSMKEITDAKEINYKQLLADEPVVRLEDYINERNAVVGPSHLPKEIPIPDQSEIKIQEANVKINKLEEENVRLKINIQRLISEEDNINAEHERKLAEAYQQMAQIEEEQRKLEDEQNRLKKLQNLIRTINYDEIIPQLFQQILLPNFRLLRDTLKSSASTKVDQIPRIDNIEQLGNGNYRITLAGLREHHDHFRKIFLQIQSLSKSIESAKAFYQRELNRQHKSLMYTCSQVSSKARFWILYMKLFSTNIQEKLKEYIHRFNSFLDQQTKILAKKSIEGSFTQPWMEIRSLTNQYREDHSLFDEIDSIKYRTFELFIEQNISYQRIKTDKKPTEKSTFVAQQMIENVLRKFRADPHYHGYQLQQMQLIPSLLQQINIYYSCFTLQLPLFESAIDLLDKIERNTVTTITTSTGSGKSSLLPALLLGEGYDKIIVTQPRRLPCQMISRRVNETMVMDTTGKRENIAGWAVSGAEFNPDAQILFLTDGLLRERLLYDEHSISTQTPLKKGLVIFLDEVHERSINIDLCLAFLARLLTKQPELKSKLKIIISSATLNESVPNLFKNIKHISVAEFSSPQMGTPYPVTKHTREKENILDIVQELYKTCQRSDQILCFVNSALDATQYCKLLSEITKGAINARVLIQSQSPKTQYANIEEASVLFSTTIAETSLTFPSLRYVIDTGYINLPIYDPKLKRTVLTTVPAANSTIKQRLGRVGRTKPGDYYALYGSDVGKELFPRAHICLADLTNVEFSLRRSPLKCGLNTLQKYLPDRPTQEFIDYTVDSLRTLGILEAAPNNQFTNLGNALAKIPDFGSISMSLSVLSALRDYNCGYDLICLSSILGVLNTTAVLPSIPSDYKHSKNDFMTLFKLMDEIVSVTQSTPSHQFDIDRICQAKGLTNIRHVISPAIRRYQNLQKSFDLSNDYREQAYMKSGEWENIAKALLAGYSDTVFISSKELKEKSHTFVRSKNSKDIATLDFKSTLSRSLREEPAPLVIARDVVYSSAIRERAVLSFVGEIQLEWMEYSLQRQIELTAEEETFLNDQNRFQKIRSQYSDKIHIDLTNKTVTLRGISGVVINAERRIYQDMINTLKFKLKNHHASGSTAHENLWRNLAKVSKMPKIFHPMIWREESEKQIEIIVTPTTSKSLEITIKGRDSEILRVQQGFYTFMSWLSTCAVLRDPDAGVQPRILRQPMHNQYIDIDDRISRITDSKRTRVDLHNGVKGRDASRETRMEVVAWIAACKFNCKIEGGFVRDWVVDKHIQRPKNLTNPKDWISYEKHLPCMVKEVVPSDIDCHLPKDIKFDIEKFQDELHKYDIKCKVYPDSWRYVLLIDEDERSGPFTMDLIEPHVALTHDRIDFDVSNLYLEKDYTREIGMRVDIQQKPYSIELESIIDNIKKKRFRILRSKDHTIQERIEKMEKIRGWTQYGEVFPFLPSPDPQYYSVLVPLLSSSVLYKDIATKITAIDTGIQIKSIEQIKNPLIEDAYEAMKNIIARQCPGSNPNERELFHGTSEDAIQGITDHGFDDRYFSTDGRWGHGAYFADDPKKSHGYTSADSKDATRVIFYAKVVLGNISKQTKEDSKLVAAPIDHHSIQGSGGEYEEYIVYRYGQALPYLKITYK